VARRSHPPSAPEHSKLIDDLGGPLAVAKIVGAHIGREADNPFSPQNVTQWRWRGIPFRYRACLAIRAREKNIGVPKGFLGEQAKA
jgi:hypothetical protein